MAGDLRRPSPEMWEYIRRKKRIEYEYAKPYLSPTVLPLTEPVLRQKVRTALLELPKDDWVEMQCELEKAYRETIGRGEPDVKDICAEYE